MFAFCGCFLAVAILVGSVLYRYYYVRPRMLHRHPQFDLNKTPDGAIDDYLEIPPGWDSEGWIRRMGGDVDD